MLLFLKTLTNGVAENSSCESYGCKKCHKERRFINGQKVSSGSQPRQLNVCWLW